MSDNQLILNLGLVELSATGPVVWIMALPSQHFAGVGCHMGDKAVRDFSEHASTKPTCRTSVRAQRD
jgi:hypothetical protein